MIQLRIAVHNPAQPIWGIEWLAVGRHQGNRRWQPAVGPRPARRIIELPGS